MFQEHNDVITSDGRLLVASKQRSRTDLVRRLACGVSRAQTGESVRVEGENVSAVKRYFGYVSGVERA